MNPLATVHFVFAHLEKTNYLPLVNALLFALFAAAVFAAIRTLIGADGRRLIEKGVSAPTKARPKPRGLGPEANALHLRVEPYIDFGSSIYFALVGMYSALVVALAATLTFSPTVWWHIPLAMTWAVMSFVYMQKNIESASWAYHGIVQRRRRPGPIKRSNDLST